MLHSKHWNDLYAHSSFAFVQTVLQDKLINCSEQYTDHYFYCQQKKNIASLTQEMYSINP